MRPWGDPGNLSRRGRRRMARAHTGRHASRCVRRPCIGHRHRLACDAIGARRRVSGVRAARRDGVPAATEQSDET
jgi:hypothetical protein